MLFSLALFYDLNNSHNLELHKSDIVRPILHIWRIFFLNMKNSLFGPYVQAGSGI